MSPIYSHYNPEEWFNPTEFIPERFDPESVYFNKPNSKEIRDVKSFIPFSYGIRNWAGQTLAKLEMKVILSRVLAILEFQIDQNLLCNNYARLRFYGYYFIVFKKFN